MAGAPAPRDSRRRSSGRFRSQGSQNPLSILSLSSVRARHLTHVRTHGSQAESRVTTTCCSGAARSGARRDGQVSPVVVVVGALTSPHRSTPSSNFSSHLKCVSPGGGATPRRVSHVYAQSSHPPRYFGRRRQTGRGEVRVSTRYLSLSPRTLTALPLFRGEHPTIARTPRGGASSLSLLKRPSARRGPGIVSVDRNVRSKCRCSCVLQFTS